MFYRQGRSLPAKLFARTAGKTEGPASTCIHTTTIIALCCVLASHQVLRWNKHWRCCTTSIDVTLVSKCHQAVSVSSCKWQLSPRAACPQCTSEEVIPLLLESCHSYCICCWAANMGQLRWLRMGGTLNYPNWLRVILASVKEKLEAVPSTVTYIRSAHRCHKTNVQAGNRKKWLRSTT